MNGKEDQFQRPFSPPSPPTPPSVPRSDEGVTPKTSEETPPANLPTPEEVVESGRVGGDFEGFTEDEDEISVRPEPPEVPESPAVPPRPPISEIYKRPAPSTEFTEAAPTEEEPKPIFEERVPAEGKKKFLVLGFVIVIFLGIVGGSAYILFNIEKYGDVIPVVGPFLKEKLVSKEPPPAPTPPPSPTSTPAVSPQEPTPARRDATRKTDLDTLVTLLQGYRQAHGVYPQTTGLDRLKAGSGGVLVSTLVPSYAAELPYDPTPNAFYGYSSDGTTFRLTAVLENQNDPECILEGTVCIYRLDESGEVLSRR